MMKEDKIIGLMKGQIPFTEKTLSNLSDMIEEYPYFQAAHLLHTLNLLHLKDAHFLTDIHKTAIYMPDRKRLFFQVENEFFDPEQIKALEAETLPTDSPFELIDTFLSESGVKADSQQADADSLPISTDYAAYFLFGETEDDEAPPLQHQDAIDRFLANEAASPFRIKLDAANEKESEIPETTPETTTDDGFFSETLAKIYMKQQKYDKALEIFRKLNLLFPEKSRYFADQIRFLEKLIINANKIK